MAENQIAILSNKLIMPYSFSWGKDIIINEIMLLINSGKIKSILDVGAGAGVYGKLLKSYGYTGKLDALEIWDPYVEEFKLKETYDNVFVGDVRNFDLFSYDYVIFGDVVEHLTYADAKEVLKGLFGRAMIAVPFKMEQGEYAGNIYETHLQPDLTISVMKQRYPEFNCLAANKEYGYFINY